MRFVSFMAEAQSFPEPSAAQIQTFIGSWPRFSGIELQTHPQ